MKHLLNNISEEEKNRIREQHEGGMNLAIDNFKKLVETKSGDVKPYLSEQKNIMLPSDLKININKLNGDAMRTIELDNKKVEAEGDIVKVGGKDIDKDMEITVKYDCKDETYTLFYGNGNNFDGSNITGHISDEAKESLKNIKTYCSGSSVAL